MKKILRRVFLSIFIVLILGGAVAVYFVFFHGSVPVFKEPYVTDPDGMSYYAVVNDDGETYAAVTDADGNIYAAKINENGSIGETIGQINGQVDKEKLPTNYTGESISDTANANDFTGEVSIGPTEETPAPVESTTAPQETPNEGTTTAQNPQGGKTTTTTATTAAPGQKTQTTASTTKAADKTPTKTTYRIDKYQQMFASGQYKMVFQTDDETLGDTPITAAVKNGNVMIDTQMESWKIKMLYIASDDSTYILIDSMKKYCKVPEDFMGEEFDMNELMANVPTTTDGKITQSKATINGKSLNCETVTNKDGTITRYYFDGDTLVRIDNSDKSGEFSSIYISSITSDVPDSTFEIPSNYRPLNIPWKLLMDS